jgi:hypothetical protein
VPKQKSAQNQGNKSITRPLINHRWAKYYHISLALRFESNASTLPSAFAIFSSIPISRRKNISKAPLQPLRDVIVKSSHEDFTAQNLILLNKQ